MNYNPLIKNTQEVKNIDALIKEVFSREPEIFLPKQESALEDQTIDKEIHFKKRKLDLHLKTS